MDSHPPEKAGGICVWLSDNTSNLIIQADNVSFGRSMYRVTIPASDAERPKVLNRPPSQSRGKDVAFRGAFSGEPKFCSPGTQSSKPLLALGPHNWLATSSDPSYLCATNDAVLGPIPGTSITAAALGLWPVGGGKSSIERNASESRLDRCLRKG